MKVKETIIVEGTYDKIKLGQIVDATIITTGGFSIFKDKAKMQLIRNLAIKTGIVVLTDSDRAGFMIRNYIKQCVPAEYVKHAYIPEIKGVEKRKRVPGKEGLLGVEGVNDILIRESLINAGCIIEDRAQKKNNGKKISKIDLFEDGLLGKENSSALRKRLTDKLGFPSRLSTNSLLEVLNTLYTYEEYKEVLESLK